MAAIPASKPVTLPVAGSLRENSAPWSVPPRISLPRCLIVSAQEPAGIAAASATRGPAGTLADTPPAAPAGGRRDGVVVPARGGRAGPRGWWRPALVGAAGEDERGRRRQYRAAPDPPP